MFRCFRLGSPVVIVAIIPLVQLVALTRNLLIKQLNTAPMARHLHMSIAASRAVINGSERVCYLARRHS